MPAFQLRSSVCQMFSEQKLISLRITNNAQILGVNEISEILCDAYYDAVSTSQRTAQKRRGRNNWTGVSISSHGVTEVEHLLPRVFWKFFGNHT